MKISNRLHCVADKVPMGSKVADIGTDHAWVPVYLMKTGRAVSVIASDVKEGPIQMAKNNISRYKLQEQIETRLGSGLTTIGVGEVDTIILAGMGGPLMISLLEESREVVEAVTTLILQPQLFPEDVRKWLHNNHFKIIEEDLVFEDGKWYEIIVANKGLEVYEQPMHYLVGKKLFEVKHPLLRDFIEFRKRRYDIIVDKTKDEPGEQAKESYENALQMIQGYQEVLGWL